MAVLVVFAVNCGIAHAPTHTDHVWVGVGTQIRGFRGTMFGCGGGRGPSMALRALRDGEKRGGRQETQTPF